MAKRGLFKLLGGAMSCPPGFYCMDFNTVCFGILIVLVSIGIVVFISKSEKRHHVQKPTVVVITKPEKVEKQVQQQLDPRFAPLPPEQSYDTPPDRGFASPPIAAGRGAYVPINIQTHGYPDTFQQVGLLTTAGGSDMSATPTRTILPLFGRKLITNRNRWNYYTRTDGMNPVQVPVQFKRRNCDSDNGCDEIMEGDSVGVPIMGQSYIANIYKYSTPRYLPSV